jgi:putative flippase GtrA
MTTTEPVQSSAEKGGQSRFAVIGRQAARFTVIGVAATFVYLFLYLTLREVLSPQPANYLAWAITAIVDTAANRRWTFDATCRVSEKRAQVQGFLIFLLSLVFTSVALALLDAWVTDAGRWLETATLLGANLAAGLLRFELLRRWTFAERKSANSPC